MTKDPRTHFRVRVTYNSFADEETVCFFEVSLGLKKFINQVNKTIRPPKEDQRVVLYMGIEDSETTPPLPIGTELNTDELLGKLDNSGTHLIHIRQFTHFKVKVINTFDTEEEKVCDFKVSLGLEKLIAHINKSIKPPVKDQQMVIYMGVEGLELTPPIPVGTELDSELLAKLDNSTTHLLRVTKK